MEKNCFKRWIGPAKSTIKQTTDEPLEYKTKKTKRLIQIEGSQIQRKNWEIALQEDSEGFQNN